MITCSVKIGEVEKRCLRWLAEHTACVSVGEVWRRALREFALSHLKLPGDLRRQCTEDDWKGRHTKRPSRSRLRRTMNRTTRSRLLRV